MYHMKTEKCSLPLPLPESISNIRDMTSSDHFPLMHFPRELLQNDTVRHSPGAWLKWGAYAGPEYIQKLPLSSGTGTDTEASLRVLMLLHSIELLLVPAKCQTSL